MSNENNENLDASSFQRRTIVKGAAWSVPVLAVAASVPLASASQPETPCPDVSTRYAWTDHNKAGLKNVGPGWYADGRRYGFADDNASRTSAITKSMFATIEVVAGTSYTFEMPQYWYCSNTREAWLGCTFYVDGQMRDHAASREVIGNRVGGQWRDVRVVYEATESKVITLEINIQVPPTSTSNDSIDIWMPVTTCS